MGNIIHHLISRNINFFLYEVKSIYILTLEREYIRSVVSTYKDSLFLIDVGYKRQKNEISSSYL